MPIALRVYFPDASSRSLIMDSATTAGELVRQIGRKLDAERLKQSFEACQAVAVN